MCGRFTQTKSREEVLQELGEIELPPLFHRRYNIAPTQKVAIIRQDRPDCAGESIWGFSHPHAHAPVINARSETLTERPMFNRLLSNNRCLIPANGFYEWKGKQPYCFETAEKRIFAFAGLWLNDRCVIITRSADANIRGIHDRMPLIFTQADWHHWLERFHIPKKTVALEAHPVSRRVNSVTHDDPACLAPADVQTDLFLFPDDD